MLAAAALTALTPVACAALLDDDVTAPADAIGGVDASVDGAAPGSVDARSDVAPGRDGEAPDADTCAATGTLRMDDVFGQKDVPVANARTVVTPAGQIVTVGSATCGDAGVQSVAVHAFDVNDTPGPLLRCLGSPGVGEVVHTVAHGGGLFVVATRRQSARGGAGLWTFTETGAPFDKNIEPAAGAQPLFAHPAGNVVWATLEAGVPMLRVDMPALGSRPLPQGTQPLTGASDGKHFYVVLHSTTLDALVVRRYELTSGAFGLDTTFNPPDYSLAGLVGAETALVGLGSVLAESGTLLVAVPAGPGVQAVVSTDGGAWKTVATVPGFSSRTLLSRSCDGSLVVAMAGQISRVVPGVAPVTLKLPTTRALMSLARDPQGRFVVQVSPASVLRVLP